MEILQSLTTSLMSPMVLAFVLGILATLMKSDFKISDELYAALTIYLLFAIGLKGGAKLEGLTLASVGKPILAAIGLSVIIPFWCYGILRKACRLAPVDAGAIAAHYGSVSAVTFSAALAFLEKHEITAEGYLPALLAIMEVPAIIVAIFMARRGMREQAATGGSVHKVLHEMLTSKGILLLLGGLVIGLLSGKAGYAQVAPLFDAPFKGVLTLFLMAVGMMTGRRLHDLKQVGFRLVIFALAMPLLHAVVAVYFAKWAGMSVGATTVLATLAASASYIAAPAAVRIALPQASPALYFTTALALTFPFNIVIGIPLYYDLAKWVLR
jgi:uncharacterized protein